MSAPTRTFYAGDRCMFLVQESRGAAPTWVTGTILATLAWNPYAGYHVKRDGYACHYFIAEEEVRSL